MKLSLSKLYLEPTTQCNLQCRTCIRNSWDESVGSMDMSVYRKLFSDLKELQSTRTIAFWGIGEPLMHPEIIDMVAFARRQGLKTEVITNGHLLDGNMAKGLIDAGLDTLVVSVDGASQESYGNIRHGGDLQKVEENMAALNEARTKKSDRNLQIGLEFVMMKSNMGQLPGLAQRARSMKADFIILTNLLPCSDDMKDEILYWISATTNEEVNLSKRYRELALPRLDMRAESLSPLMSFLKKMNQPMPDLKDAPQTDHCPFIQKGSAAITWSGDVSPCIGLMHSHRCYILGREKFIRKHAFGNILQEKIGDIWNKKNYRHFRDRVLKFDFAPCVQCSGCHYAETNEEDCFGNTHPVCGDCLWAKRVLLCP